MRSLLGNLDIFVRLSVSYTRKLSTRFESAEICISFQAKRVVLYLGRAQPVKTLDELMVELQTVETLNCTIERTETPPFYRCVKTIKSHWQQRCHARLGRL